MIKALQNMQHGLENPKSFQASFISHRIFNIELSSLSTLESFHTADVTSLDIDKVEDRYLLSASKNAGLCIHDLLNTTGKSYSEANIICKVFRHARYNHKYSINTASWYPFDSGVFITSSMDCTLKLWDTNVMRPVDCFNMQQKVTYHHLSPVPNQHSLIAVSMQSPYAVLLDPKSGSKCHQLRAHRTNIETLQWSPLCSNLLATGTTGGQILLWDVRSAQSYLKSLDQHNEQDSGNLKDLGNAHDGKIKCLRFTSDGLYLVSYGTDYRIRLWDVALASNTLVNYGVVMNTKKSWRLDMDLSCDSSSPILFFPCNNKLFMYDLLSGNKIKELRGHLDHVNCCVYRSSYNQLLSGASDQNILLWSSDVALEKEEGNDSDDWSSEGES